MDGFLLINKPIGMTSHDVVFKIKKKFHLDKIGHTGTLDPFASGLLVLCVGRATKLAHLFSNLDKAYEGTIIFGQHFDTFDTTGNLIKTNQVVVKQHEIEDIMAQMIGTYDQLPPMYSAIKVNGRKLYDLARQGQEVDRLTRKVNIYDFRLTSQLEPQKYTFYVFVSKGTYIRSLAVDLAKKLDNLAVLDTLNRLTIGQYNVSDSKSIEEITKDDMISLKTFFQDYPTVVLNDYMINLVKNGVYLDERQIETEHPFIVLNQNQEMIAYYEVIETNKYKPILIF
ncbi:MAG: tRNA pseudouridine(55) synthase TruB [Bacillota bacterium]